MEKLHQSQVKAYHEAAMKSLKEWASSFPLQPMEEADTKIAFVNRCIASTVSAVNTMPNWKLDNAKITAVNEVRKRAVATFEKYHPTEEDANDKEDDKGNAISASASGDAETADEADEESDDGAITEDGELTADDDDDDDDNSPQQEQKTTKTTQPNRKKGKAVGLKKSLAQKKGTRAKNGFRNNKGGRGARRGGRGGGRGAQK